jgi:hypothetical protein
MDISSFAVTPLAVSSSICRNCESHSAVRSRCFLNARNAARNGRLRARSAPNH